MKFDIDRAMAWAGSLDFPRGTGGDGEVRAADLLAERFEQAGWRVTRAETRTGCRMCTVLMILGVLAVVGGYLVWKAWQVSLPGSSRLARGAWFLVSLLLLAGALRLLVGRDALGVARRRCASWRKARGTRRLVNLVATWPSDASPGARVLIVTPLDIPLPLAGREDWAWCAIVLALLAVALAGLPAPWAAWSRVVLVLCTACFLARYWLRVGRPSPGDNRTGLAIVAELARSLPAKLHERVEIRLAAVSSSAVGQLGSLTLADEIRRHWPGKPTLVINLDAAGVGPDLLLAGGRDALRLAQESAKGLWIPHRVVRWPLRALDHGPFLLQGIDAVSLAGDRAGDRIQPATLAATAQLVNELALRWARRGAVDPQPETLARSSQNPG